MSSFAGGKIDVSRDATICVLIAVLALVLYKRYGPSQRLPGPPSIPILGSLPWIGSEQFPELVQREWREKYGALFQVDFGMRRMIIVADEPTAKEILVKHSAALGDRPQLFYYQDELGLDHSFVPMADTRNPLVEPSRRLNMKVIRTLGSKGAIHASAEIANYLSVPAHGHNVDPHHIAHLFAALSMLVVSHGLQLSPQQLQDHKDVNGLLQAIGNIMAMISFDADSAALFPILRFLRPFHTQKMIKKARETRQAFLTACSASEGSVLRDVKEAGGFGNWPDCTLKFALTESMLDVSDATTQAAITLGAGAHTTTLSVTALLGALAFDQDLQHKLRLEVAARSDPLGEGNEAVPSRAMALVRTLLRKYPPVPSTTPRLSTAEIRAGKAVIPKGSIVFPIIESINDMSPFDVEKEMEEAKLRKVDSSGHWAFGFGRRACPAGAFAEAQIAYFCADIVSKFVITFEDKETKYASIDDALKYHYFGLNRVAGVAKLHFEPVPSA